MCQAELRPADLSAWSSTELRANPSKEQSHGTLRPSPHDTPITHKYLFIRKSLLFFFHLNYKAWSPPGRGPGLVMSLSGLCTFYRLWDHRSQLGIIPRLRQSPWIGRRVQGYGSHPMTVYNGKSLKREIKVEQGLAKKIIRICHICCLHKQLKWSNFTRRKSGSQRQHSREENT